MTLRVSSTRQGTALVLFATVLMAGSVVAALGGFFFFAGTGSSAQNNNVQAPAQVVAPDHLNGGLYAGSSVSAAATAPQAPGCVYAISSDNSPYSDNGNLCPGLAQSANQAQGFASQATVAPNIYGPETPIQAPSCAQMDIAANDGEYGPLPLDSCLNTNSTASSTSTTSSQDNSVPEDIIS